MNEQPSLEQQRAEEAERALDATLGATEKKAKEYQELARVLRRRYSIAKTLAVVLGVSTPAFVAFQTQHTFANYSLVFSVLAILLTTGTGIVTGLQAAFKWGEGFGRYTTAAQQLDELIGSIRIESEIFRTTPDNGVKREQLKHLHERILQQMQQVIRTQTQAEIADISEPAKPLEIHSGASNALTSAKGSEISR